MVNVAHMVVPRFADWSAVDVMEDDRLHRLAVAHVDPDKMQLARDLEERYPSDRETAEGAWGVVRSGQSVLFPEITDEMLVEGARDEEHLALARSLQLRSLMMVPLMARDRLLGVMTWAMAESGRHYTEADVEFGEDLASRAAVAMDNAQLHTQLRDAALQLQHAVLPDLPPDVPGWELAAHYQPSGRTEVGGDFYDVCPLEDGRMAVFVGDVMGRGVAAAAAMAQMRSAVRAFIAVDPAPEHVMGKLDRYFRAFDLEQLVTVAYLVLDPASDELELVNAGHLPPVVLRADGTATTLPVVGGPPLGLADDPRVVQRLPFAAGDAVLGYTDGLVERRDEDLDVGLRRLEAWVPGMFRAGPATTALRLLAEELRDRSRDDDLAMVFVRRQARS
jgi:serine phosphatase RsbU (regulator of sigma subunit)